MSFSNDGNSSSSLRRVCMLCIGISGLLALVNYSIKSDLQEMNVNNVFDENESAYMTDEERMVMEDDAFFQRMLDLGLSGPIGSGPIGSGPIGSGPPLTISAASLDERSGKSSTQIGNSAGGNQALAWKSSYGRSERSSPLIKKPKVDSVKMANREVKNSNGGSQRRLRGRVQKTGYKPFQPYGPRRLGWSSDGAELTSYAMMEELNKITTRFYIYDDPIISQKKLIDERRGMGEKAFAKHNKFVKSIDHVRTDADSEKTILGALESHPLRTMDPNKAEIFVVPTPVSELLAYGCQWENCTWYDEAFDALAKQPTFQKAQGHKHVIVALSWPLFSKRWSAFIPAISRKYNMLQNVTVAHNYDPFGCQELNNIKKDLKVNDFKKIYDKEVPLANAVSLGLGFNDVFPAVKPTYDKFETSRNFIFYHSRTDAMAYGSTPYRFAPLDENVIEQLPPSSIGFDVPREEWVADFTSSKFCLVIRSDTPHSHALLYSLRAGCIPVIVSDDYPLYAPTFKSSMALEDFSIFIEEEKFLEDPTSELLKLQDIPRDVIETKLEKMYIAQTLAVPSHPNSLFVPALLKEVIEAENNVLPEQTVVQVHEDYAILSGWEFMYRYPSTFSDSTSSTKEDEPTMITGVVSKSKHFNARHTIRGTWADERPGRVFFIVAGPWKDIENEFLEYGDLLWLNMAEDSSLTTNKVQLLLQAVDAHVETYDYVMKTTDDTYVWLDDVEHKVVKSKANYWGTCQQTDEQQRYAHGMGYVLSREFNECAASYIESIGLTKAKEDIATSDLAELCGVTCQEEGWDWWLDPTGNTLAFITGGIKGAAPMIFQHWWVLWKTGGWSP